MSGIMSMLLGAVSSAAAAADEFFNRVTLLLNTGSTNGAQNNTFLDSSSNNFSITRNGNTTQGTFTPFSQTGWSNNLTGSATSLRMAANSAFDQNAGSFSIECWVYPSTIAAGGLYIYGAQGNDQLLMLAYGYTTGLFKIDQGGGGGGIRITSANTYAANTWHHVAYTYDGTTLKLFINGNLQGTATSLTTIASPAVAIGEFGSSSYFNGYVSNFRICRAAIPTAYQTASTTVGAQIFTPATTPLTTTSQGASNVSFLTCQSNNFVDNSTTPKAITITGTPSVQAFSPFAPTAAYSTTTVGGSGYFDGTGDYLSVPDDAAFTMGSGDFTIEAWVYVTATSGAQAIFGTSDSAGSQGSMSFLLYAQNGSGFPVIGVGYAGTMYYTTSSDALVKNQWNHIAGVRNGATVTTYVNGVSKGTLNMAALAITDSSQIVGIGRNGNYNGEYLTGYISNARIVKGTAVYTGNFTPPRAPLSTSGSASSSAYPSTTNVNTTFAASACSLLTNFTNAGIFDSTAKNDLETVGNAQVSTTTAKFGTTSMYFDGAGDYLVNTSTNNPLAFGTGDFTIEFWLYLNSTGTQVIFDGRNSSSSDVAPLIYYLSGLKYYTAGADRITGGTLSTGQWYYIALVKASGSTKLYINGTQTGSTYTDGNNYVQQVNRPVIGAEGVAANLGNSPLNAYIDELRITKGYARTVTSNPTAAFPVQ